MKGYYRNPEKTAETIDSDGWLHSGDIGQWMPNGTLKIIDRKKNIFKLSQGEYVAPDKCENIFAQSKFVAQSFTYGDSLKPALVGVVVPDPDVLVPWAEAQDSIAGPYDLPSLCANPAVRSVILKDIDTVGRAAGLNG
jgi:long-chain acyl-CoA synthetase